MEKIKAHLIIQIAGKPQENVEKALTKVLEMVEKDERWKVLEADIVEAEYDEESTLYSGFIEMVARFPKLSDLMEFIIDYTPNSVEIEDPEKVVLDNVTLTSVLNEFSTKMLKSANEMRQLSANLHFLNQKVQELEGKKEEK